MLITCETETFVLGVYASRKEAQKDFIDILIKQQNFPGLRALFRKEFFEELPTSSQLLEQLFFPDIIDGYYNQYITDFLMDNVLFNILEVNFWQIFDFINYS